MVVEAAAGLLLGRCAWFCDHFSRHNGFFMHILKAPFPWFGGKSRVVPLVWERFGDVPNYVEPFAGSLAVLLGRPHEPGIETVNDKDCFLANFWRALLAEPEAVAHWADWPVNEADLHARHLWLVHQTAEWRERMKTDPDHYDAKIAGWWVWGISQWIGGGWCSRPDWIGRGNAMRRSGINTVSDRVHKRRPSLTRRMGVHQKEFGCYASLESSDAQEGGLFNYITALAMRLRCVRVCCGDWSRIMGPSPTFKIGFTGVFLDPPYSSEHRDDNIYSEDSKDVAHDVCEWCLANGDNPLLRIALCGYEGEHEMPDTWDCVAWKANGGYGNRDGGDNANAFRERIWFSPACIAAVQPELF